MGESNRRKAHAAATGIEFQPKAPRPAVGQVESGDDILLLLELPERKLNDWPVEMRLRVAHAVVALKKEGWPESTTHRQKDGAPVVIANRIVDGTPQMCVVDRIRATSHRVRVLQANED